MINIGIIGAGIHGWDHCLGFDRLSDSQILAVADPSEKQIKRSKSSIQGSSPDFFKDYKELLKRIKEHNLPEKEFEWYLDLRKFGSVPHSGFGFGLERICAWVCGLKHIRETIPFPRMINRITP